MKTAQIVHSYGLHLEQRTICNMRSKGCTDALAAMMRSERATNTVITQSKRIAGRVGKFTTPIKTNSPNTKHNSQRVYRQSSHKSNEQMRIEQTSRLEKLT